MANAEQIKALIRSYADRDDARFCAVAMQVAADQARKGKHDFAAEIQKLVDSIRGRSPISSLGPKIMPIASPRGELSELLFVEQPEVRLSSMVLSTRLRKKLERTLQEQRKSSLLAAQNLHPRRKLLFTGPPGCGKTMAAAALAGELGIPLLTVRMESLITKFLGETSAKLALVFQAISDTRAVYLFDEFDSIGIERGVSSDVGEARRIVNTFLSLSEKVGGTSLLIAATNHGTSLDKALFRRFDDFLEFPLPDDELIRKLLFTRITTAQRGCKEFGRDSGLTEVVSIAKGLSFGDIANSCDDALKKAVIEERPILVNDLIEAIQERRSFMDQVELSNTRYAKE
jgi:SpoVK/Ycf46/Vps4 family AAA+-type ATPase